MDCRLWFAGIGITSALVLWGMHRAGRKRANAHLTENGILVEAEILECQVHTDRFAWTELTYRYLPEGAQTPQTVKRKLDGGIRLAAGDRVPVRYLPSHPFVSILVGHEKRHDAS